VPSCAESLQFHYTFLLLMQQKVFVVASILHSVLFLVIHAFYVQLEECIVECAECMNGLS
jgi:hypothetical protein